MTTGAIACRITLDTHDPSAMATFYRDRFGFVHSATLDEGVMYERWCMTHPDMALELVFRSCLPRPHVGSTPGSITEIALRVEDPESVSGGLHIESREPEEGPARRLVVRDPSNYTVAIERA